MATLKKVPRHIYTLFDLFRCIKKNYNPEKTIKSMRPIVRKYIGVDWMEYVAFSPQSSKKYKRFPLPHYSTKRFEFVLITWRKGQCAPIHNHPENGCLVLYLQGCLEEVIYNRDLEEISRQDAKSGDITYLDDSMGYHEIIPKEDTVTLHIYAPPNYKPKFMKSVAN